MSFKKSENPKVVLQITKVGKKIKSIRFKFLNFNYLVKILFVLVFLPQLSFATVIGEVREIQKEAGNAAFLLQSISGLLSEIEVSERSLKELEGVSKQIDLAQRELRKINNIYSETEYVLNPYFRQSKSLAGQINQLTSYIRRVKSLVNLIILFQGDAEAAGTAANINNGVLLSDIAQSLKEQNMMATERALLEEKKKRDDYINEKKSLKAVAEDIKSHSKENMGVSYSWVKWVEAEGSIPTQASIWDISQ